MTGHFLLTERDLSVFFIPPRIFSADLLKHGQLPLWNPYSYCGHPLLAVLQPGIFYPINLLLILLPFDLGFNLVIVLHYFLAGLFTYFFIKSINGSNSGALIGALIFMLSGYLLSVHNLLTHLLSVVWLPLILLCYQKYLKEGKLKPLAFTSVCIVMMFLGAAVEILYGTLMLMFILVFFPDPFGAGVTVPPLKKRAISFALVLLLFVLLSAVQLFPFIELAFNSIRAGGLSYGEATTWSLDFQDAVQFFIPDPYGYASSEQKYWGNQCFLKTIYLGIIPFALSIFFVIDKKRKAVPFFAVMLISLILSFGGNTSAYKLLYNYVPFLNTIRYPVKFLFIFVFLISVMAGVGYNSLCRQIDDRNWEAKRIVHGFLAFSVLAAFVWGILNYYETPILEFLRTNGFDLPDYNYAHINLHNMKRFLFFCLLFGPVLVFGWSYPKRKTIFSFALISLLTLDLFFANKGYYQVYDAESFHQPPQSVNFLKKDSSLFRILTSPKTVKERIQYSSIFSDHIKVYQEKIAPGFNVLHQLYSIDGAQVIRLASYEKILTLIKTSPKADSTNLLSLLNVKYVISKFEIDSEEFELSEIIGHKDDPESSLKIYRNLNVLPRAFLVERYKVVNAEREYKNILQSKTFQPQELVLLDEDPLAGQGESASVAFASSGRSTTGDRIVRNSDGKEGVIITKYQANMIELEASLNKPKMLFISEAYYPGWKVYIDGNEGTIYRANHAFRAVPLGPGRHKVMFVYRPLSLILGGIITLLGIIATVLIFVRTSSHRKNPH